MEKNNLVKLLGVFSLVVGFSSCQKDDEDYPVRVKPEVSIVGATSYNINEGDDVTITLRTNSPYKSQMDFKLEVFSDEELADEHDFTLNTDTDGDPEDPYTDGEGFGSLGYKLIFPAFATEYTFSLSAILDDVAEGTEKIRFRLTPEGNLAGTVVPNSEYFEVNIANKLKNTLDLTLDWNKSFDFSGTTYTLCGLNYDVDIQVFDSAGNPFGAGAQTAACPEHLSMNLSGPGSYPNGTYTIAGYLWDDITLPSLGLPTFDIPVTVTYFRGGSSTLDGTFTQSGPGILTSDSTGDSTGSAGDGALTIIAYVQVSNGVFTIKRADNSVVASGKGNSAILNKMKAAFVRNRR